MQKRMRLFELAAEEFLTQPYDFANLKKIAQCAGITKDEILPLAGGKELSRRDVLIFACDCFSSAIGPLSEAETAEAYIEKIEECHTQIANFFEQSPALALLTLQAMDETNEIAKASVQSLKTKMRKLLIQGQKLGFVRKELRADILLQLVCSYMKGLSQVVAWQHERPSRMSRGKSRGLIRMIFDMNLRILSPETLLEKRAQNRFELFAKKN